MMLITADPVTRIRRRMHYHHAADEYVISHEQDDREILEGNKASYNSYRKASDPHAEMGDLYGRIPAVVWGRLIEQGIANDTKRLKEWLNDSDNRVFRRRPGRL